MTGPANPWASCASTSYHRIMRPVEQNGSRAGSPAQIWRLNTTMSYDGIACRRCRGDFPSLARKVNGQPIAFLDGPGGTQTPETVLAAISDSYIERNANFDGMFSTSLDVTAAVAATRNAVADFLGADGGHTISFGANMTTLNFSLSRALLRTMKPGDEAVITQLDHEANRGPWLQLEKDGIIVREVEMDRDGRLRTDELAKLINERTRVVAIGIASNSLGTVTNIGPARELCDSVGAYLVVDAVHYAAHLPLDVTALGADFLLCSAYKFYGPHVGILYCRPGLLDELDTDRLRTQKGTAPYRIETGTLNHAAIAGVAAAIDYIAGWGKGDSRRERIISAMSAVHRYELQLACYYSDEVKQIDGVKVWGPDFDDEPRAPTVSISVAGRRPEQIARFLAEQGLQVWHGHFYAVKVLEVLGLTGQGGLLRAGISMYNTREEIDRLLSGIELLVGGTR